MVRSRDDIEGLDAAILMHPRVWEASGHVAGFTDPLVDCRNCKKRFRADDPKIKGVMVDVSYSIYFMNCTDNEDCEDLNFYAGFLDLKPKQEDINSWNRDKRFGKAYIDSDGDAVVEMDLNLEKGISSDNLDADISVWSLVLDEYTDYIHYKK